MNFLRFWATSFFLLPLLATAATLRVENGHGRTVFNTQMLLARPDIRALTIPDDIAFHRVMRYRALPLLNLLPDIGASDQLQFTALDGFAARIPASLLTRRNRSMAWLAVEDPAHPWPRLPGNHGKAGPFYVVWTDPDAENISPEQWPYQLAAIRVVSKTADHLAAIRPAATVPSASPVQRGFLVYQRICSACHTLNGEGASSMGPDLNVPHNPTEYLPPDLLRAFVRDNQTLRHWPQARMPAFNEKTLPDSDLDALLAYLRYMAAHKVTGAH